MKSELMVAQMIVDQLSWWASISIKEMKPDWEIEGPELDLSSDDKKSLRLAISTSISPKFIRMAEIKKSKTIQGLIKVAIGKVRGSEPTDDDAKALFDGATS